MVGEVRDTETAELALRASLTGHLVLTTLHTNDAVAAVTRLVDMGVEPFLVASSLSLVVGQRLVRSPCAAALRPYEPSPADAGPARARRPRPQHRHPAPRPRLRGLRRHRLPGPDRHLRGAARHRRAAPGAADQPHRLRHRRGGPRRRDGDAARRRHRRRRPGRDHLRGGPAGHPRRQHDGPRLRAAAPVRSARTWSPAPGAAPTPTPVTAPRCSRALEPGLAALPLVPHRRPGRRPRRRLAARPSPGSSSSTTTPRCSPSSRPR